MVRGLVFHCNGDNNNGDFYKTTKFSTQCNVRVVNNKIMEEVWCLTNIGVIHPSLKLLSMVILFFMSIKPVNRGEISDTQDTMEGLCGHVSCETTVRCNLNDHQNSGLES